MVGVAFVHDRSYHDLVAKAVVTRVLVMDCLMIHPVKAVCCNDSVDDSSEAAMVSSEDTGLAVVRSSATTPADYR